LRPSISRTNETMVNTPIEPQINMSKKWLAIVSSHRDVMTSYVGQKVICIIQ
jgi:hypothetical protein